MASDGLWLCRYGTGRFLKSVDETAGRRTGSRTTTTAFYKNLTRRDRECLYMDAVGPYPYAKGPLVAYRWGGRSSPLPLSCR